MPAWLLWTLCATLAWSVLVGFLVVTLGRIERLATVEDKQLGSVEPATFAAESNGEKDENRAATDDQGEVPLRFSGSPLQILVVDDDRDLRALLRTSFEVADIEVDEADSARSAAQKIASRRPDVIVLDVAMPGTDGITF